MHKLVHPRWLNLKDENLIAEMLSANPAMTRETAIAKANELGLLIGIDLTTWGWWDANGPIPPGALDDYEGPPDRVSPEVAKEWAGYVAEAREARRRDAEERGAEEEGVPPET